jgi:hypothetical protein
MTASGQIRSSAMSAQCPHCPKADVDLECAPGAVQFEVSDSQHVREGAEATVEFPPPVVLGVRIAARREAAEPAPWRLCYSPSGASDSLRPWRPGESPNRGHVMLLRLAMRPSIRTTVMVRYALLAFLLGSIKLATAAQGGGPSFSQPSFDCAKARSPLALLICSGEETARADWDLRGCVLGPLLFA